MVHRERLFGAAMLIVSLVVLIGYSLAMILVPENLRIWVVAIPVWLAIIIVLGILMWIGWTMATVTPTPIEEELEGLEEEEEKEEKEEEKKEE